MTEQIPADLADKVRKLAAQFRQQMEPHVSFAEYMAWERAAEAVEALLPAPPRPTLADMTEEERRACQWMQCDVETWGRAVIVLPNERGGRTVTLNRRGHMAYEDHTDVTPRPDLPRMKWPGTENPEPASALPDGWRLADHKDHGRVIVTNSTPNSSGYVCIMLSDVDNPMGRDWDACLPDELTYLDTEPEEA